MPYKSRFAKLQGTPYDRRRKLTDEDREDIVRLAAELSVHQLAKNFGVSRRLVQFVLHPERHEENLLIRKERGGSAAYNDKDKHTAAMRRHSRYKQKLYKKGLIK